MRLLRVQAETRTQEELVLDMSQETKHGHSTLELLKYQDILDQRRSIICQDKKTVTYMSTQKQDKDFKETKWLQKHKNPCFGMRRSIDKMNCAGAKTFEKVCFRGAVLKLHIRLGLL